MKEEGEVEGVEGGQAMIDLDRKLGMTSCEDSDSYITLSDSSLITSTYDDNDLSHAFKPELSPLLMEIYENKSGETTNGSDEKHSSHKLETRREKFVSTTNIVGPSRPENITQIIIGDPEGKKHKGRERGVLQKSVRMFRKSKSNPESFFKSKSEGNIKELVDNESKPSLLQSYKGSLIQIYRNLRPQSRRSPTSESGGFLSLREEVNHLDHNQRMIGRLSEAGPGSLPPVISSCESSLFSCFTAGSKPIMPNHRSVLRPRDIKECVCLSPLMRSLIIAFYISKELRAYSRCNFPN